MQPSVIINLVCYAKRSEADCFHHPEFSVVAEQQLPCSVPGSVFLHCNAVILKAVVKSVFLQFVIPCNF